MQLIPPIKSNLVLTSLKLVLEPVRIECKKTRIIEIDEL